VAGAAGLLGSAAGSSASTTAVTAASAGAEIPDETAGPFPADGSNGPNVLTQEGVVRADLRESFGASTGTAPGVPTTVALTVVDAATGTPLAGAAVYAWHCTADGRYSVYQVTDQNYLRGVQTTDTAGKVSFTTVFPGCYQGRWPHVHFEVYPSLDDATSGSAAVKVSQLALPQADAEVVYAEGAYSGSAANLARLSLDTDNVFRDGWAEQLATVSGSVAGGYTTSLLVRV
jgi:protocatechuate 3,4-dioxygenase beta subunit